LGSLMTFFSIFFGAGSTHPAASPGNCCPNPFVEIVPRDLGHDLKSRDRARDFDASGKEPADRKCVEGSKGTPADGLENRPCVRFCPAE
jgi:hypothetical protein